MGRPKLWSLSAAGRVAAAAVSALMVATLALSIPGAFAARGGTHTSGPSGHFGHKSGTGHGHGGHPCPPAYGCYVSPPGHLRHPH
jgi:hypothetical protein